MPRVARPISISGFYHVTARGTGRLNIYEDDADRYKFLTLVTDKFGASNISLCAWALMSNHFHLMVDDPRGNLSSAMHSLETSYARYFNSKSGRVGHLFQNRFDSVPVENDIQAIALADYIHLNPVKAGISNVEEYRWSSFKAYKLGYDQFGICDPTPVLDLVGGSSAYLRLFEQSDGHYPLRVSKRPRVDERHSIEVARDIAAPFGIEEVKSLEPAIRSEILVEMRRAGLTVRQIERIIGLGRTTINVCTAHWKDAA